MEILFKFMAIWLSLDIVLTATVWYASTIIAPRWPNWWKQVVVDIEPDYHQVQKSSRYC